MLDKAFILSMHLTKDGFFQNGVDYLNIIDDYSTKGIKDNAIDFYINGFKNTGVHNINIYYQIRPINPNLNGVISNVSRITRVNSITRITSFLTFILNTVSSRGSADGCDSSLIAKIAKAYSSDYNKTNNIIITTERFVNAFRLNGINVVFRPYSSLGFNPPFHGRYWINENKGYIVDGSLNTYSSGRIFAQLMDQENFSIISDLLKNNVEPNRAGFSELRIEDLLDIHQKFIRYSNEL